MSGTDALPKDYQKIRANSITVNYLIHKYGLTTSFIHATVLADNLYYNGHQRHMIELSALEESESFLQKRK
jgi:hypothetical protein